MKMRLAAGRNMRVKIEHSDAQGQDRIAGYARELLCRMLESYRPQIRSVTIKVGLSIGIPFGEFDYHCTILLKIEGGATIRADARDCDDILAVYRALSKIIDQITLIDDRAGNSLARRTR